MEGNPKSAELVAQVAKILRGVDDAGLQRVRDTTKWEANKVKLATWSVAVGSAAPV
jgi:hypothetical protein